MVDANSPIDGLISDHERLLQHLLDTGETSYHATLESTIPKVFLIAAASWMEDQVKQILLDFFKETTHSNEATQAFIRRTVIDRGFHTLFDWDARSPSRFFANFGEEVKKTSADLYKNDAGYAAECSAFLELGDLRNQVVHRNYASFTLEKTSGEVGDLYRLANKFVARLPQLLRGAPVQPVPTTGNTPA